MQDCAGERCYCLVVALRLAVGQPVVEASEVPEVVDSGFVGQKALFRGRNHAVANTVEWRNELLRQWEDYQGNLHGHTSRTRILASFGSGLLR